MIGTLDQDQRGVADRAGVSPDHNRTRSIVFIEYMAGATTSKVIPSELSRWVRICEQ